MKKTVLITGASRGIGRAAALAYAAKKYNIIICSSKSEAALFKTAEEIQSLGADCIAMSADVSDYASAAGLFETAKKRFGRTDILINNAGISHIGLLQDMSPEEWNRIVNVNLTSVFNTCRLAVPDMIARKEGSIVNISSVWGICGASCEVAYSAAKGGVNAFTRALAKELAPSNINVNAVACGVIDTDMNRCFSENERTAIIDGIPAGRMGTPEETAQFICAITEESPYLTGQVIAFDGGYI